MPLGTPTGGRRAGGRGRLRRLREKTGTATGGLDLRRPPRLRSQGRSGREARSGAAASASVAARAAGPSRDCRRDPRHAWVEARSAGVPRSHRALAGRGATPGPACAEGTACRSLESRPMPETRHDCLVIGAGVIGLACAHALARAGREVTLLEAARPGSGASHGNCGTITPSHAPPLTEPRTLWKGLKWLFRPDAPLRIAPRFDPPLWRWLAAFARQALSSRRRAAVERLRAALLLASRRALPRLLADAGIDCGFRESGVLYVFREPASFRRARRWPERFAALGIAAECWEAERARAEEPLLRPAIAGAVLFPGDACLRPERLVAGLAEAAVRAGVRLHAGEAAWLERDRDGEAVVRGTAATRRAELVLLATGARAPALLGPLGIRLPIQPGKGYSLTFPPPAAMPRRPLVLADRSVCVTPWAEGLRLGSTMEFSGFSERLDERRLRALERGAAEHLALPALGAPAESWYGFRPMTPDELPVIGRAPGLRNLLLATGHGMLGVSLAAVTAELVAALVLGREPPVDPAPLSPARFG
ncbi:MAG: FAD-dependent oxidoreductase [Xanthomonadales bacterium]|nr:FAD-dependent oxidoreductase [Xanthomonadales bacterium]